MFSLGDEFKCVEADAERKQDRKIPIVRQMNGITDGSKDLKAHQQAGVYDGREDERCFGFSGRKKRKTIVYKQSRNQDQSVFPGVENAE